MMVNNARENFGYAPTGGPMIGFGGSVETRFANLSSQQAVLQFLHSPNS